MTASSFNKIMEAIYKERQRQDGKWGEQNHEAPMWKLILDEELGETAKSYLESNYSNYIGELIQSAAVIVAWLESEFRNMNALDAEEIDKILAERTKDVKSNGNISIKNNLESTPSTSTSPKPNYLKVLEGLPPEIRDRLMYGKFGDVNYGDNDINDGKDDKGKKGLKMDFMVADIYARTYYKGELPNPEEVSKLTEQQREEIVELTLQARRRDDRWIIDFLNESNENHLIIIGYYIQAERKLQSIGINKIGRQIVVVSNIQSIHKVSGLDIEKTKALMLYDSLSSFEFKYLMEEVIRRKYQVITDHPM